jgi:gluconate 2-dehydrogenase gamma chain
MTNSAAISRRRFLQSTGAIAGTSLLRIGAPALAAITQAACTARQEDAAFVTLGDADAAGFAAIAARIIPTTATPGATEAGVIYFFDAAFGNQMANALAPATSFLAELNEAAGRPFAELGPDEQDALLAATEADDRFQLLRVMTIFGFFAMEKYGGNRNHVGWELIGFQGHHGGWEAPFGYYDAEYAKEHAHGE